MPVCPNCSNAAPDGARFCESCGGQLPTGCSGCGQPLAPAAAFCGACGTPTAPQPSASPITPPVQPAQPVPPVTPPPPQYQAAPQPPAFQQPPPPAAPYQAPAPGAPQVNVHVAAPAAQAQPMMQGQPGGWKIPAGYVFALLGGLIGVILGAHLWRAQVTGPQGVKVPRYNDSARFHGKIILAIACVATVFWVSFNAAGG